MALALMSIGEKRTVQSLRGKDETLRHLQDLGFAPGAEVECVGEIFRISPDRSASRICRI